MYGRVTEVNRKIIGHDVRAIRGLLEGQCFIKLVKTFRMTKRISRVPGNQLAVRLTHL